MVAAARCKRPIVFVKWEPAGKDVKRGPSGEAIWIHHADAGLDVSVLDWDASVWPDKADVAIETTRVADLNIYFVRSSRPMLEGRIVDFDGDQFVLRQ